MRKNDLLTIADKTFERCLNTLQKKNADYAGNETQTNDALRNFKLVSYLNITSTTSGILVRLCDKLSRISNIYNRVEEVKEETVFDTIEDAINYLIILKAALLEEK